MTETKKFRGRVFRLGALECPVVGYDDERVLVQIGHESLWLTPDQLGASEAEAAAGAACICCGGCPAREM